MPQLNPAPWFPLLLLTWGTLLLLMMKTTHNTKQTDPTVATHTNHHTTWPWPWY
uniref:ATP synthase complex subunit 8 n=1 Tax=Bipes biporus TaxID=52188 RepID=Q66SL0_BIPBI|nr:ATP synthase F0 subunit 8 [Bipes biporus]AAT08585.1 ATP synthase F0 subunit 8 [Bipes biporus]